MTAPGGVAEAGIRLSGVTKRYGERTVLAELDLEVAPGELVAVLGPNGAGKTTAAEMVEGYLAPDEGSVRVLGLDPRREGDRLRPRLGLVLQRGELPGQLRVDEILRLFAAFYREPLAPDDLIVQVGLGGVRQSRYRSLSGGERQRLALCLALIGRPDVAVLDEPTAAMDVAARRATWEILRELRAAGAAILLTTHLADEAEALADRVAVLSHGRIVAAGPPALVGGGATSRTLELRLPAPLQPGDVAALAALVPVESVDALAGGRYVLSVSSPGPAMAAVGAWLVERGIEPVSVAMGTSGLEALLLGLRAEDSS